MSAPPPYLAPPVTTGHLYGTVTYDAAHGQYVVDAEPAVREFAKRLFPGSARLHDRLLRFRATRRSAGDLNWLMLRFPLALDEAAAAQFAQDRDAAIAHAHRREALHTLTPATTPPTFLGTLFPFQAEDLAFIQANRKVLVANGTGTGKTVTALALLAVEHALPALIITPPHLQTQWAEQIAAFLSTSLASDDPAVRAVLQERGMRDAPLLVHQIKGLRPYELPPHPIHLIHYGLLRGWRDRLPEVGYQAVIFEEIHELRHTGTEKYSVASLIASGTDLVVGLSATPIFNLGAEMWAIINMLDYHALGDAESFSREWCVGYGAKQVRDPKALGDYLRREGIMINRDKHDCGLQLPKKRRVVHVVDKDDAKYTALISEAITLVQRYDREKDWSIKGQLRRQIGEADRRATGIAKAPMVAAFVRSLVEAGERVLVFAHHHDVHDTITEALADYRPARHTGRETAAEKAEQKRRFIDGETPIIQIALRAAAGIDGLQRRGTAVVFAELDWTPAVHTQCEDRLERPGFGGEDDSILCCYLVTDTGSDETIREALGLKVSQFTGIMGRAPETEEERVAAEEAAAKHLDKVVARLRAIAGLPEPTDDDPGTTPETSTDTRPVAVAS